MLAEVQLQLLAVLLGWQLGELLRHCLVYFVSFADFFRDLVHCGGGCAHFVELSAVVHEYPFLLGCKHHVFLLLSVALHQPFLGTYVRIRQRFPDHIPRLLLLSRSGLLEQIELAFLVALVLLETALGCVLVADAQPGSVDVAALPVNLGGVGCFGRILDEGGRRGVLFEGFVFGCAGVGLVLFELRVVLAQREVLF